MAYGPYEGQRETTVFEDWKRGIETVAKHTNVVVKTGGCGMPSYGFGHEKGDDGPPASDVLAAAWKPYFEFVLEHFGADRCMFESNFPVDKLSCSYNVLYNSFKLLTADYSANEKAKLYHDTAARVYKLDD